MGRKIYLDAASTTYVGAESLQEMLPLFDTIYGNPHSLHSFGRAANAYLDTARDKVAKAIGAKATEIYFTSGATEANNWAIKGLAYANKDKGKHIITSQIEHPSILNACKELEKEGFKVTYLPVDKYGIVSLAKLMHHLSTDTILVSIMAANNEVGTIQHLNALAKTVKERGVLFHSDAVQIIGNLKLNVKDLDIDAISISSHKIYGPKGVGALYLKSGVRIKSLMQGGAQEFALRAGTVNVPAAVGFGKAIEIAKRDMVFNNQKIKGLRDYFVKQVVENIEGVTLNGHPIQRLSHIASLSFDFIESEAMLLMLDMEGIAVSAGSACSAGDVQASKVLKAMGVPSERARGTLRFSLTKRISKEDIDYVVEKLIYVVNHLRQISPLTKKTKKGV